MALKRNKYSWGKSLALLQMEVESAMMVDYTTPGDYGGWRTVACHLRKTLGGECEWSFQHVRNKILIIRWK